MLLFLCVTSILTVRILTDLFVVPVKMGLLEMEKRVPVGSGGYIYLVV